MVKLKRSPVHSPLFTCFLLLVAASTARAQVLRTIYTTTSAYNIIQVFEDEKHLRYLGFGTGTTTQSVVKLGDPTYLDLEYAKPMMTGLALAPNAKRVLVVGLGGGSLPMFFRHYYPDLEIDVVELDPAVLKVAQQFFGFREDPKLRVIIEDGRKFIQECQHPYDIIFLDAYSADDVPYALITKEFLTAVRHAVSPEGLVVANLWSSPYVWYDGMVRTYLDVFGSVSIIPDERCAYVKDDVINHILLARISPEPFDRGEVIRASSELSREKSFPFNLGKIVALGFFQPDKATARGKVLLDADAPKDSGQ